MGPGRRRLKGKRRHVVAICSSWSWRLSRVFGSRAVPPFEQRECQSGRGWQPIPPICRKCLMGREMHPRDSASRMHHCRRIGRLSAIRSARALSGRIGRGPVPTSLPTFHLRGAPRVRRESPRLVLPCGPKLDRRAPGLCFRDGCHEIARDKRSPRGWRPDA